MDMMPVALVLLLMLLFATSRQPEPTDPDVADMPFGTVQKLFFELERMRQVSDQEALTPYREAAGQPSVRQIDHTPREAPEPKKAETKHPPWSEEDAQDWSRYSGQQSA